MRPTGRTGESFSRYAGGGLINVYGYNDRSELTSGQSYQGTSLSDLSYPLAGRGFGFAYDNIGNRTSSSVIGANSSDVRTTTYTANSLNQITSRDAPGSSDVTGLAPASATLTLNGSTSGITRQGDYYFKNISAGSRPLWQAITASSSLGGSATRYSFIPASSETIAYDADGNLTSDGRWNYTWDAENRLVAMETASPSVFAHDSVNDARRIEFAYDYLGRRVEKYVRGYNGSSFITDVARTRFAYNGWNVVAEYSVSFSSPYPLTLARTNAWGLDLSGTLTDGGGVGGLLSIKDGSTFHLPVYDANGNVAGLVNKSDGTLTAAYEYSPFGENYRSTGTYAATNNFRFSTKYTDAETGLACYGYRYYDAKMGRFLGRDPSGESGGLNLYGFVSNNPVNCWDRLGLAPMTDYDWEVMDRQWQEYYNNLDGKSVGATGFMSMYDYFNPYYADWNLSVDMLNSRYGGDEGGSPYYKTEAGFTEMPDVFAYLDQHVGTWHVVNDQGDAVLSLAVHLNVMGVAQENSDGVYVGPLTVLSDDPPASGSNVAGTAPNSSLDPYAVSTGASGNTVRGQPPVYPIEIGGLGYTSRDAAGVAGSLAARTHTTATVEFGGEVFSYQKNGSTLYGYMAPRPGAAQWTENGMTYHPGPPINSSYVPNGMRFEAGYHAHFNTSSFSDDGRGTGDLPTVRQNGAALYLARDNPGMFGGRVLVEVATPTSQRRDGTWNVSTSVVARIR